MNEQIHEDVLPNDLTTLPRPELVGLILELRHSISIKNEQINQLKSQIK